MAWILQRNRTGTSISINDTNTIILLVRPRGPSKLDLVGSVTKHRLIVYFGFAGRMRASITENFSSRSHILDSWIKSTIKMYTKFSPTPNATSEEFVQRQLDRVLVAALYLEHNQITREQFQEELSDVCSRVEAQKSHALQEHTLYFDQVMKVFPDLHFRFKPFSKLWRESSTSFPIPGWFSKNL